MLLYSCTCQSCACLCFWRTASARLFSGIAFVPGSCCLVGSALVAFSFGSLHLSLNIEAFEADVEYSCVRNFTCLRTDK